MRHIHTAWLASAVAAGGLAACDVGGSDGGGMGSQADAGAPEASVGTFEWLIVWDVSSEMSTAGTPGVDICGASFTCDDGTTGWGIDTELALGSGRICNDGDASCDADRSDPAAALGRPELACEPASAPSDYVSLGRGGILALKLGVPGRPDALIDRGGLAGCMLTVVEAATDTPEAYQINVCDGPDARHCIDNGMMATASGGGSLSVAVPE